MKIAYVLTTYPCLTETFACREIEYLRSSGFIVKVLAAVGDQAEPKDQQLWPTQYRPGLFSQLSVLGIVYLLGRYPMGLFRLVKLIFQLMWVCPREAGQVLINLHAIGHFARILDKEQISHLHGYFLNWPACIAMALSKVTGRTFSMAGHGRDIFVESGALEVKASLAQFIVVCSRGGLDYLKDKLPENLHRKLHLAYHGVNAVDIKSLGDKQDRQETIIAAGRFVAKKGFDNLLHAFSLVRKVRPGCRMVIVGDGPRRKELERLGKDLGIDDVVGFKGRQEHYSLMYLLGGMTVLAVPSILASDGDRDGVANIILEAFAHKVPVVASDVGGIGEAVRDRQTGLLVEPGNIRQLADGLLEVLEDKQLGKEMSQRAYEFVTEHFDIEKNTKAIAELLENTSR